MRTIVWLQKACNAIGRPLDLDLPKMYRQCKENIFNYRTFRKTAETSGATFQDQQIEKLALSGQTEVSSVQLRIANLEASQAHNRMIKNALGNNKCTGVTQIVEIDPYTSIITHLRKKGK